MAARIPIAVVALVSDGRVLLVHRHPARRDHPDCWDLPGGHVEPGESFAAAARREAGEELGIVVRALEPVPVTSDDPALDLRAFLVTAWDGEPDNRAPDEHDDLRWFGPDEVAGLRLADPASSDWLRGLARPGGVGTAG